MATRWWGRVLRWFGFGLAAVVILVLLVVLVATQTAYGLERVRLIVVRVANQQLSGSLHVGALRFGPGCSLAIDSVVMRDPGGTVVAELGPVRATCRFAALTRGRLVLTSIDVARPYVLVEQSAGGAWNWSRVTREDSAAPVVDSINTPTGAKPARLSVDGPVRIHSGTVILDVPGMPQRVLSEFSFNAPRVTAEVGGLLASADLQEISANLSEPPISLHRLSGSVSLAGDSAEVELPFIGFGQSKAGIRGWVQWRQSGTPAMSVHVTADSLAFSDLAWITPTMPPNGGGRFDVTLRAAGGGAPMEVLVRSADLRAMRSRVRGSVTVRIDSSGMPIIDDANLVAEPLHTDLLHHLAGDALPADLRGALTARVVARGLEGDRLRVETLDARYVDGTGAGGTSWVTAKGDIALDGGGSAASLEITAHQVDARTVAKVVPSVPLQGILSGTMTVTATPKSVHILKSDLRYSEGDSTMRLTGNARIDLATPIRVDLELDASPFAPSAIARSFPSLAGIASFDGPIELRGTPEDLSLTAGLRNAAGSLAIAGRYRTSSTGMTINATVRVRDADPRSLTGRGDVPSGTLDADIALDLTGDSVTTLRGRAEVSQLAGNLAGVAIEPSLARFSLTATRVVAESVSIATSAGSLRVRGALGRRPDVHDTLTVTGTFSLDGLEPLLRSLAARDSTTSDSVAAMLDSASGTVNVNARITGSLDSMAVEAQADAERLALPPVRARGFHAAASLSGLPGSLRGTFSVRADSLATQGARFTALVAEATSVDSQWVVRLATSPDDRPGGETHGTVALRGDTVSIGVDSLVVRIPGSELRLSRPTRFAFDSSGSVVIDTVEMRGSRGAAFKLAGVVRDTGAIALSLDINNVPLHMAAAGTTLDSVRTRVDARLEVLGTAAEPRATLRSRVRLIDADSVSLDSIIAEVVHDRGRTRFALAAHGQERGLLRINAEVPVELSLSPFKAVLTDDALTGDIVIDSLWVPDVTRVIPGFSATAGVLRMKLALSGTARHPRATGTTELQGVAVRIPAIGIRIHDVNSKLDLSPDRLTISASARGGEKPTGQLELSGVLGIVDSTRTDFRIRSSWMPVLRLADLADLDVSSDLRLVGPSSKPTLSGSITVDRGVIRLPEMGNSGIVGVDDSAFARLVDSLAPSRASRSARTPAFERLDVGRITVAMGPNVWLRSSEASIQIGGSIGLERAKAGEGVPGLGLALRGALTTQRGNYRFTVAHITRSFDIEEGAVTFTGEPEFNPRLDINALYEREGYDPSQGSASSPTVRLHVGGRLDRPTLTFSSADAKLSQSELMSYLITGQTHFALGDVQEGAVTSELVAGATAGFAQRVAGGVFDVVDVTAGSSNKASSDNRGAVASVFASSRLGVGKQLSNRVFLKVDAGLCALTGGNGSNELWQSFGVSLDYRFNRGLLGSLSSAPSTNGANCSNQAGSRGTALAPRQWGFDFNRIWRF